MTAQPTSGVLHLIFEWVEEEGPAKSLERLRLMILPALAAEDISIPDVTATTDASSDCLSKVRTAAKSVVGKDCPH